MQVSDWFNIIWNPRWINEKWEVIKAAS